MRFAFIHAEKARFPIARLCTMLRVSRQGYYAWAKRPPSSRDAADRHLAEDVSRIHASSRGTYGSPRVRAALRREGRHTSKRRVERTMRELGLRGRTKRKFRTTTVREQTHPVAPNHLNRCFTTERPNEAWVTDITYIDTREGWSYLAAILDLYSRRVVGWSLGTDLTTELALSALSSALHTRRPPAGLIHHSDRGCQYTSGPYRAALEQAGIQVSMSRKGNCWDNAVAESFFASLKRELIEGRRWYSHQQLREAMFEYIEVFYNRQRLHSTLHYQTPVQIEANHAASAA